MRASLWKHGQADLQKQPSVAKLLGVESFAAADIDTPVEVRAGTGLGDGGEARRGAERGTGGWWRCIGTWYSEPGSNCAPSPPTPLHPHVGTPTPYTPQTALIPLEDFNEVNSTELARIMDDEEQVGMGSGILAPLVCGAGPCEARCWTHVWPALWIVRSR